MGPLKPDYLKENVCLKVLKRGDKFVEKALPDQGKGRGNVGGNKRGGGYNSGGNYGRGG